MVNDCRDKRLHFKFGDFSSAAGLLIPLVGSLRQVAFYSLTERCLRVVKGNWKAAKKRREGGQATLARMLAGVDTRAVSTFLTLGEGDGLVARTLNKFGEIFSLVKNAKHQQQKEQKEDEVVEEEGSGVVVGSPPVVAALERQLELVRRQMEMQREQVAQLEELVASLQHVNFRV